MRFGIYCEMQTPPGKSHYDMTWEIMRQIEHADECGLRCVFGHRSSFLSEIFHLCESAGDVCGRRATHQPHPLPHRPAHLAARKSHAAGGDDCGS